MTSTCLDPLFLASPKAPITISKFSDLDLEARESTFATIASLNSSISTDDNLTTWDKYTDTIIERLQERPTSQNTFFVAQDKERIVGYVAFYTQKDRIPYPSRFINESQAYCSWTAVDETYRGQGLAVSLKLPIFDPEHCVESFRGHVKKTNAASLRIIEKFSERGHKTSTISEGSQVLYTIYKA